MYASAVVLLATLATCDIQLRLTSSCCGGQRQGAVASLPLVAYAAPRVESTRRCGLVSFAVYYCGVLQSALAVGVEHRLQHI